MAKANNNAKGKVTTAAKGTAAKGTAAKGKVTTAAKGKVTTAAKGRAAQPSRKAVAQPSRKAAAKAAQTSRRERKPHQPLDVPDNAKVVEIKLETMRQGSLVRRRFEKVRKGMTVAQIVALADGPTRYDLACAANRDRISFKY